MNVIDLLEVEKLRRLIAMALWKQILLENDVRHSENYGIRCQLQLDNSDYVWACTEWCHQSKETTNKGSYAW